MIRASQYVTYTNIFYYTHTAKHRKTLTGNSVFPTYLPWATRNLTSNFPIKSRFYS